MNKKFFKSIKKKIDKICFRKILKADSEDNLKILISANTLHATTKANWRYMLLTHSQLYYSYNEKDDKIVFLDFSRIKTPINFLSFDYMIIKFQINLLQIFPPFSHIINCYNFFKAFTFIIYFCLFFLIF